ncbi:stomatin-like protein [Anaeramoeba flamelloides]|uniref:Stomatin-like protein n=1 Tax=Anaeramoeba flamelloides TaxID=1746091 RepID=A0AAV7ZHL3_9EUKA|nr:stomatin-like protein 2 [Anaeramoeba flamelloides]KAJ6248770.1 stomatin-like protein [Anaeramoeba flamelloides]
MSLGVTVGISFGSLFGLILIWFLISVLKSFIVVAQNERVIVESWGKYNRTLTAGFHCLMPVRDRIRKILWKHNQISVNKYGNETIQMTQSLVHKIDLRESLFDFPLQSIITRDNVELKIHLMALYQIVDPVRVCYEIYDLPLAVGNLVKTTLRSVIGAMGLDDTLASRDEINQLIQQKVSHICLNWGFKLNKVELLEIIPTKDVQIAMNSQIAAERIRRASIIEADGQREKVRTEAEGATQKMIAISKGRQQVTILIARGQADSRTLIAEGEARALKVLAEAVKPFNVDATQYLISIKYLETFGKIATSSSRSIVYFPLNTNLVGEFRTILNTRKK